MVERYTGPRDLGLHYFSRQKIEYAAALPAWDASYEARIFFVTTAGANYGQWNGGKTGWERPGTEPQTIAFYVCGADPNDDFTHVFLALQDAATKPSLHEIVIFVRDDQLFSPNFPDQIAIVQANIRLIGLPSTNNRTPVLTFSNTQPPSIQLTRGSLQIENLDVKFNGTMPLSSDLVIDMLSPMPVYLWRAKLIGEAWATGSILGVGANGSPSGGGVQIFAFASEVYHSGAGQAIRHKGPAGGTTNNLTVWSFGSTWGASAIENVSTDVTTTQNLFVFLGTGCSVSSAAAFTRGIKNATIYIPPDYLSYTTQASVTAEVYLGKDTKLEATYAPINYAVGGSFLFDHLAGIDAALGAVAGAPGNSVLPTIGNYTSFVAAMAALALQPPPPPTHPAVLVNWEEELGVSNTVPPQFDGIRVTQEGRVIGELVAVDQDMHVHANGKDNCIRHAWMQGTIPTPASPMHTLSITCMGIRDDNLLVPGDVGSPWFPAGVTFSGVGLFYFKLHSCEVLRPIISLLAPPPDSAMILNWQFVKFYGAVTDINPAPSPPYEESIINSSEFFGPVSFIDPGAPTTVKVDGCWFESLPVIAGPNLVLEVTNSWVQGTYCTSGIIDSTGLHGTFEPPKITDAEKALLPGLVAGMMIYNLTTNVLEYYNGAVWVSLGVADLPPNVFVATSGTDLSVLIPTLPAGATLWLGATTYTCTNGIVANVAGIRILGCGKGKTIVTYNPGIVLADFLNIQAANIEIEGVTFEFNDLLKTGLNVNFDGFRSFNSEYIGDSEPAIIVNSTNAKFFESGGVTTGQTALRVAPGGEGFETSHSRYEGTGDYSTLGVVFLDSLRPKMTECDVVATHLTNAECVRIGAGALSAKVHDNDLFGQGNVFSGVTNLGTKSEVFDNEVHSTGSIAGILQNGPWASIHGNQIRSDTDDPTVTGVEIGGNGNNLSLKDNIVEMQDVVTAQGFSFIGGPYQYVTMVGNHVRQTGPVPDGPFLVGAPFTSTVAPDGVFVANKILPMAGAGATGEVAHNR